MANIFHTIKLPCKTLILFDEIQDYPDIATSLKPFCIDGRFDVICSGSMLGINYHKIASNSAGYKSEFEMQSMDFEEFLWAKGYGDDLVTDLLDHMKDSTPLNQTTMNVLNKLFLDYCILVANLDEESKEDLRANKNMNIYKCALYENIIAESLSKQGYELFYYKKENATLEQDFFVRTRKSLVPVEVKATNGNAKSLKTLIAGEQYPDITTGIKLIHGNIGFENSIHTFPYFCTFLLKRYLQDVDY